MFIKGSPSKGGFVLEYILVKNENEPPFRGVGGHNKKKTRWVLGGKKSRIGGQWGNKANG
jgi:hypothetical protein